MRWVPLTLLLIGCNKYDMFAIGGFFPGYWPPKADVLFVIDNSKSMFEESETLALTSGTLARELDRLEQNVDRGEENAGAFPDYQFSITTLDAGSTRGRLLGEEAFFGRGDKGLDEAFNKNLLCEATCFPAVLEGRLTEQDLNELCGDDRWRNNCGGDVEEGLETVFLAMCRAVPIPPVECFDIPELFNDGDVMANEGLLRKDSVFIPIIITDEGDASRRMTQLDIPPTVYNRLFKRFDKQMAWAVLGPSLADDREPRCPSVATSWGVLRYSYITQTTGGLSLDIHAPTCQPGDFEDAFSQIANLIGGRSHAFPLRGPAIESTIVVTVDKQVVPPMGQQRIDQFGFPVSGDGWRYDDTPPTVILSGEYSPEPSQEVRVYYKPLDEDGEEG